MSVNSSDRLIVGGNSLLNGSLHIIEASGTAAGASSGSIRIDHENSGGASSITFTSRVNSNIDFGYIQYQDASVVGGSGDSSCLIIGTQNNGDDHIILAPSGNVGIGIATPQNRFTIRTNYSDENTGLMLDANDGAVYNIKFFSYVIGGGLIGHKFKLQNQSAIHDNMLCFGANGNTGIGVSNPQRKLHIVSANPQLLLESSGAGGGVINFGNTGHGVGRATGIANFTAGNDVVLWTTGDGHCGLATAGGSLRVSSNGNVGIGNLVPLYLLSVGTNLVSGSDGKISIGKNNGGSGSRFFTLKYNANFDICISDLDNRDIFKVNYNAPENSLFVAGNGNVGIGNANPGGVIHISSNYINLGGFVTWVLLMNSNNSGGWAMCADNAYNWNLNLYWFAVTNSGGWARIMGFENDTANRGTGGIFAFTGQHPVFINNITYKDIDDKIGLIVCANNNDYININGKEICRGNNAISINESLPICSLCVKHKDKSCFGVISYGEDPESRNQLNGRIRAYFEKELGDTRIYINSVGEGALWVSNKNGNLESGDYITSSSIIGYGEKQDDDVLHNYTVAKITMNCDFDPLFKPIKKIKKNYVDEIVYRIIIPLDKKDKIDRMNYNYIFDTETNFCYYDITVEKYNLLTQEVFSEWDINDKKLYSYLIKNSLINDLENDIIQWEDSIEYEYEYNIRYLDNENNIILKDTYDNLISNNIICWIAAFVGCTYHCG